MDGWARQRRWRADFPGLKFGFGGLFLVAVLMVMGCSFSTALQAPPDTGQRRFLVTEFGADPGGQRDSTAAIEAAIEAAGYYAAEDRRHEVVFPEGTYKVMPRGILHLRIWEKRDGEWSLLADEPEDTRVGNWIISDEEPEASLGGEGDHYLNRTRNRVWRKESGQWLVQGPILLGRGEGWRADFFPPIPEDPETLWIQYRLRHTNPRRSVLRLTPDANFISIIQEEGAVIDFRCWGDVDPMDYEVSNAETGEQLDMNSRAYLRADGKWWMSDDGTATAEGIATAAKAPGKQAQVVVRTAIPPEKWFPEFSGSENNAHRGNFIVFARDRGDKRDYRGIWFLNPVWKGNCSFNFKHNWYTLYHDLEEWDINNKGIAFTWGRNGNLYDIRLRGGHISGFRGEQVYAGGGMVKEITIEGTEISHSNASAISVSGQLTVRDAYLHHVYNGMENYTHADYGQFVEISNCRIDLSPGGMFGVVHIGEPDTRLVIDGLEVTGGDGMYFDAAAHNVSISNARFIDVGMAMRLWNINARTYKLSPVWRDFTIHDMEVVARSRDVGMGIFQGQAYQSLGKWTIDGLRFIAENGFKVKTGLQLVSTNPDSEVWISNSDLTDCIRPVTGDGVVPHYGEGNRIPVVEFNPFRSEGQVLELLPQTPALVLNNVPKQGFTGFSLGPVDRYYPGFTFALTNGTKNELSFTIPADPSWNSLASDLEVRPDDTVEMLFGEDRRFSLTVVP